MATLTCPACTAAVQQDDLICFTCGANLPRDRPVNPPATPPTVMQEYLRPDGTAAGAAPFRLPALRIRPSRPFVAVLPGVRAACAAAADRGHLAGRAPAVVPDRQCRGPGGDLARPRPRPRRNP